MNVYRGCTHGCIYCDSRSHCYRMDHTFENIEVKENAAQILDHQLSKRRHRCMIYTGAMCDPYLHIEEELNVTRMCNEVISKHQFGLCIQTKSNRILRDIDLLEEINEKSRCVVELTITTFDEKLCKIIEPNVCTSYERYLVLKECQRRHIPTVVWITPLIPFLNDTPENLLGILDYCVDSGVRGIVSFDFVLTLRDGNREFFYNCLDKFFPGLKQDYIFQFGQKYECFSPNRSQLTSLLKSVCDKYGIVSDTDKVFEFRSTFPRSLNQISIW